MILHVALGGGLRKIGGAILNWMESKEQPMSFNLSKINTVEDWFSVPTISAGLIIHVVGDFLYDVLKRVFLRRGQKVKRDWRGARTRLLIDSAGRLALHGYERDFMFVKPDVTPFVDSDLMVERMLAEGKNHEEAHQACLERYDYWIEKALKEKQWIRGYLIGDRQNKFFKTLDSGEYHGC